MFRETIYTNSLDPEAGIIKIRTKVRKGTYDITVKQGSKNVVVRPDVSPDDMTLTIENAISNGYQELR